MNIRRSAALAFPRARSRGALLNGCIAPHMGRSWNLFGSHVYGLVVCGDLYIDENNRSGSFAGNTGIQNPARVEREPAGYSDQPFSHDVDLSWSDLSPRLVFASLRDSPQRNARCAVPLPIAIATAGRRSPIDRASLPRFPAFLSNVLRSPTMRRSGEAADRPPTCPTGSPWHIVEPALSKAEGMSTHR